MFNLIFKNGRWKTADELGMGYLSLGAHMWHTQWEFIVKLSSQAASLVMTGLQHSQEVMELQVQA